MYLSPWQLAKFMVWLENELATTVPVVMLCDFFFCFQNRCAQLQRPLAQSSPVDACRQEAGYGMMCISQNRRGGGGGYGLAKTFRQALAGLAFFMAAHSHFTGSVKPAPTAAWPAPGRQPKGDPPDRRFCRQPLYRRPGSGIFGFDYLDSRKAPNAD